MMTNPYKVTDFGSNVKVPFAGSIIFFSDIDLKTRLIHVYIVKEG